MLRTAKLTILPAVLCCLVLVVCALVQSVAQKDDSHDKLLALEKMWNQAQLLRDSSALQALVGDRFVDTEWDGQVSDKEKFLADIRDPQYKPSAMSIQDVKVEEYGNTAIVTGIYHTKGSYQGKPYEHTGRFTDTWIFSNNKWQCVASHTSLVNK